MTELEITLFKNLQDQISNLQAQIKIVNTYNGILTDKVVELEEEIKALKANN